MEVIFYHNSSDSRYSVKDLTEIERTSGSFKQPFNVLDPVLQLSKQIEPLRYNYCYIPDVQRYYFVTSQPSYEAGYYNISLHSDVIVNFRSEYLQLGAIIARQEYKYNTYLNDSRLPRLANMDINTTNFDKCFIDPNDGDDEIEQIIMVVNGR